MAQQDDELGECPRSACQVVMWPSSLKCVAITIVRATIWLKGARQVTPWTLITALTSGWRLVAFGLIGTSLLVWHSAKTPEIYFAQVNVLFVAPQGQTASANPRNALERADYSLIATAGVIGKLVNNELAGAKNSSDSVTLLGQGVTEGYSVLLPDSGGQWERSFRRAELNVQVVGASRESVATTLRTVLGKIDSELVTLQRAAGASPGNMIQTRLSPPVLDIRLESGRPTRAAGIAALLGGGLTLGVVVLVSQGAIGRRRKAGRPDHHMLGVAPLIESNPARS